MREGRGGEKRISRFSFVSLRALDRLFVKLYEVGVGCAQRYITG